MLFSVTDLDILRANAQKLKKLCGTRLIAVMKYNAYSCGMTECARALLAAADSFAVSTLEEADTLLRAGIPPSGIMVLDPILPQDLTPALSQVILPIDCPEILQALTHIYINRPLRVQLRADLCASGVGIPPNALDECLELVCSHPGFELCGLFAHAPALYQNGNSTELADRFSLLREKVRRRVPEAICHLATSATLDQPALRFDAVRAGTALYGLPSRESQNPEPLIPVLSLRSRISRIFTPRGSLSFYDRTIGARQITRAGIVSAGYGHLPALLHAHDLSLQICGQPAPVIGTACMGHLLVDLSAIPQARPGDDVFFVGGGQSAAEFAGRCGIAACRCDGALFTTQCVDRLYIDKGNCIVKLSSHGTEGLHT